MIVFIIVIITEKLSVLMTMFSYRIKIIFSITELVYNRFKGRVDYFRHYLTCFCISEWIKIIVIQYAILSKLEVLKIFKKLNRWWGFKMVVEWNTLSKVSRLIQKSFQATWLKTLWNRVKLQARNDRRLWL